MEDWSNIISPQANGNELIVTPRVNGNELRNRRQQRLDEIEGRRRYEVWRRDRTRMDDELSQWQKNEERVAAIHFAFICHQQTVRRARWRTIRNLRVAEVRGNITGLVVGEERWMRVLDARLVEQGIFVGSYTKRYLVDPVLGVMPQLPPEP